MAAPFTPASSLTIVELLPLVRHIEKPLQVLGSPDPLTEKQVDEVMPSVRQSLRSGLTGRTRKVVCKTLPKLPCSRTCIPEMDAPLGESLPRLVIEGMIV